MARGQSSREDFRHHSTQQCYSVVSRCTTKLTCLGLLLDSQLLIQSKVDVLLTYPCPRGPGRAAGSSRRPYLTKMGAMRETKHFQVYDDVTGFHFSNLWNHLLNYVRGFYTSVCITTETSRQVHNLFVWFRITKARLL